jgi:hypothetical protein
MTPPIRILLVDDQQLLRLGFRNLMETQSDLDVVGEAGDGAEALRLVGQAGPDVVLMDVRMPGVDGIRAAESSGSMAAGSLIAPRRRAGCRVPPSSHTSANEAFTLYARPGFGAGRFALQGV